MTGARFARHAEAAVAHAVIMAAVLAALYPVLWVVSTALSPRELSIKQAAFLAALTSQPTSMSRRIRKAGGLDPDSAERVAVVLRAMRRDGVISDEAYLEAKTAALRFAPTALPD